MFGINDAWSWGGRDDGRNPGGGGRGGRRRRRGNLGSRGAHEMRMVAVIVDEGLFTFEREVSEMN